MVCVAGKVCRRRATVCRYVGAVAAVDHRDRLIEPAHTRHVRCRREGGAAIGIGPRFKGYRRRGARLFNRDALGVAAAGVVCVAGKVCRRRATVLLVTLVQSPL